MAYTRLKNGSEVMDLYKLLAETSEAVLRRCYAVLEGLRELYRGELCLYT